MLVDRIPLPPHAYVPGRTARHPEGWFDPLTDSIPAGCDPQLLHRTQAFEAGMLYLREGYYWECHEVLEAVWMRTRDPSPERETVQAVIQLANARLKLAMGRPKATSRLCGMVQNHLAACAGVDVVLGLVLDDLTRMSRETASAADRMRANTAV